MIRNHNSLLKVSGAGDREIFCAFLFISIFLYDTIQYILPVLCVKDIQL